MVLKNNKKHKQTENNKNTGGAGEDYISNLPDALIHHILSFLPTKCAMSTSILSKRWKYLAISIPVFDFRQWRFKKNRKLETKLFMNFLDTILFLHENPNIQKFYLGLDEVSDESRVYKWISTIMKRKIEILCLRINCCSSTSSILPLSFFTCDSLTLLDLDFVWNKISKLIIPNTVSFPNLKILRLGSLSFVDETSTRKLFSNCPILEELKLSHCLISEGLCIVNPALKHLSIDYSELTESTVKISAPNLLTISYTGHPPADFAVDSFPSLVEADVGLGMYGRSKYSNGTFVKLFKTLSSVKVLKACKDSFMVLSEADILLTDLPAFNNLIHLEGSSNFNCRSFGSDSVSIMRRFFKFLQLSPNLESIVFAQGIRFPDVEDDDCWALDPTCSLPHLKSIKFKEFEGRPMEENAIKVFLKYPGFSGTVTIVASSSLSKKRQLDLKKMVRMFPKPSNCFVKFLMSSEDT